MALTKRKLLKLTVSSMLLTACGGGGAVPLSSTIPVPPNSPSGSTQKSALVIGAGMAGLKAARDLTNRGLSTILLEARHRLGGRTFTDRSLGVPLDLGASWIHGIGDSSLFTYAGEVSSPTIAWDYDNSRTLDVSGAASALSDAQWTRANNAISDAVDRLSIQNPHASVQRVVERAIADGGFVGLTQTQIETIVSSAIELEWGISPSELSIQAMLEGQEVRGGDVVLQNGYGDLVSSLADGLDIRMNQVVTAINYENAAVRVDTLGDSFNADYVILTVPLGILKKGAIKFTPDLPLSKQTAVSAIGVGLLNKVYLEFPNRFWDAGTTNFNRVVGPTGNWIYWIDMEAVTNAPVIGALLGGPFAQALEALSDSEIVGAAIAALKTMYGTLVPEPTGSVITRWMQDEYAAGAYSGLVVGARPSMRADLARSVADRLFFAGEATSTDFPATTHGAYDSGARAAADVLAVAV